MGMGLGAMGYFGRLDCLVRDSCAIQEVARSERAVNYSKLMRQHVRPHSFEGLSVWREKLERGNDESFVITLLPKNIEQHGGARTSVRVTVEVDDIVQVAGPRPLSKRSQFFRERFFVGIAIRPNTSFGAVAVRMKDLAPHGRKDQSFIGCQVEFHFWPTAGSRRHRPAVGDLALAIAASASVFVDIEFELVAGKIEARLFGDPRNNVLKDCSQKFFVEVFFVA